MHIELILDEIEIAKTMLSMYEEAKKTLEDKEQKSEEDLKDLANLVVYIQEKQDQLIILYDELAYKQSSDNDIDDSEEDAVEY